MDKEEQRIQVIADGNDSANTVFRQSLEKKKKNVKEITIREKLTGNLNLAILQENGFSQVEVLRFKEGGQITAVTNIPTTIKRLYLSNQLIEHLELPDGIEYIDIDHNLLSKEWDLSRYQVLKHVNVSYNHLDSLGTHLPESLEKLYCTHNNLRDIFLADCPRIHTLHCNDNVEGLRIHDLPDTVIDRQFPEKVVYVSSSSTKESSRDKNKKKIVDTTSKEYQESILDYFQTKREYDKKLHYLRVNKKLRGELPPCIGCQRLVGMIFSGKDQKYRAYCGATEKRGATSGSTRGSTEKRGSPCDWKIVIHRGENIPFLPFLQEIRGHLEETKGNIIRQKMDTLFDYISDEKSAELFKKYLNFFETNRELVEKYTSLYEDIYFNKEKKEIILRKQASIQEKLMEVREHLTDGLSPGLVEAVRIQYEEIQPIAKYIQSQTYADMSMRSRIVNKSDKDPEFRLCQSEMIPTQIEINIGEK